MSLESLMSHLEMTIGELQAGKAWGELRIEFQDGKITFLRKLINEKLN
jgi:hypothetical protein